MKKIILLLLVVIASAGYSFGQQKEFMNLYKHYSGKDSVSTVYISKDMLRTMANSKNAQQLSATVEDIDGVYVIVTPSSFSGKISEEVEKLTKNYRRLLSLKSSKNQNNGSDYYVIDYTINGKVVKETYKEVIIVNYGKENVIINLTGKLNIKGIRGYFIPN